MTITKPLAASTILVLAALFVGPTVHSLLAQAPTAQPAAGVELDPIKCWWRTSATSIVIGQRFVVTLTCGVVETASVKVVPDHAQLEAAALQLTPFEIVDGRRHEDITDAPWRYFQYEYDVRLLGAEFLGRDVDVPGINVSYRVISTANETEGRERRYQLPALPVRIQSLVPQKAVDIREPASDTFGAISARRFRSRTELLIGGVAFAFAAILLALALTRFMGAITSRRVNRKRTVGPRRLLGVTLTAIRGLKADVARDGWSQERAARATSALRLGAAVASGRFVAQAAATRETPAQDGQLELTLGLLKRQRLLVSAATEPRGLNGASPNGSAHRDHGASAGPRTELLESLRVFQAARYGRNETLDAAALELALERGETAIRRLRLGRLGTSATPRRIITDDLRGGR